MSSTAYFDVKKMFKDQLDLDEFVNLVTEGDSFDIATRKLNIYPNAHIDITGFTINEKTLDYSVLVWVVDQEDKQTEENREYKGHNNRDDILNTTAAVHVRLANRLRSTHQGIGNFWLDVNTVPAPEKIQNQFEDGVSGWFAIYVVRVPNTLTIC